jgi:hypothetical protein
MRVVEGHARGVQTRSERMSDTASESVWTFRVERYDEAGNRVLLVPVEMRGLSFEGSLSDGDIVRAHGKVRSGTLRADRVENLTTGAAVRAKAVPVALKVVFGIVFLAIVAFIVAIAISIFTADMPEPPDFDGGAPAITQTDGDGSSGRPGGA